MPRPSTSRPAAAGAARHREHVAGRVVRGQLRPRHRPGEHDVLAPRRSRASSSQPRRDTARRRPSAAPRPGTRRSAPATPGSACPGPCAPSAATRTPPPAGRRSPYRSPHRRAVDVRRERVDVHARRQRAMRSAARGRQRRRDPAPGVLPQVGDHVVAAGDAPQHLPWARAAAPSRPRGRGSARPAGDAPAARSVGRAGPAARPHRTAPRRSRRERSQVRRPPAHPGVGSSMAVSSRTTSNGCSASNVSQPFDARGVDDDAAGVGRRTRSWTNVWMPPGRGGKSLVTTSSRPISALLGGGRRPEAQAPGRPGATRAQARAAASRAVAVGCVPNQQVEHPVRRDVGL